ncbi:alpha/beta fold hydrolase [Streptomyces tubercidicus]
MTDPTPQLHATARAQDGTLLANQRHGSGRPLVLLAGQANNHHWWDGVRDGDQDRLTPAANASLLTARIPRSRMHLFTGAHHAYFQERRDRAGQLVSAFLADPTDLPLPETGHS